jgi:hypothetical protein
VTYTLKTLESDDVLYGSAWWFVPPRILARGYPDKIVSELVMWHLVQAGWVVEWDDSFEL